MLRFHDKCKAFPKRYKAFQYITCYGSTHYKSYPLPQCPAFQYITCYGSTYDPETGEATLVLFQYITCYGST